MATKWIRELGFPIAVTAYLLFRMDGLLSGVNQKLELLLDRFPRPAVTAPAEPHR